MSKYLDLDGLEYYTGKIKEEIDTSIDSKGLVPVSGTNDGTNWSTLTINGTTKNIPVGGGTSKEQVIFTTPHRTYEPVTCNKTVEELAALNPEECDIIVYVGVFGRNYKAASAVWDNDASDFYCDIKVTFEVSGFLYTQTITYEDDAFTADIQGYNLDITVPEYTSDLFNDSGYMTNDDVINNVTSTTTDKPLSANMGKELQDQIDNLKSRGRFLSLWNATTGLATTTPTENPYTYKTGDYFIVAVVGSTNYKPTGSTYNTSSPSTAVETNDLSVDDVYYYDGTKWDLQINTQKTVSFSNLAGNPTDNTNLAIALNNKQDVVEKVEIEFTVEETPDDYIYQYNLTNASKNLLIQKLVNDDLNFEVVLKPLTDYEDFDKRLIEPFEIKKVIDTYTKDGKTYKDLYMQVYYYYQNPVVGMLSSRELNYAFTYNISDMIYPDTDEYIDFENRTDTNWIMGIANTKFSTEFTDMSGAMSVTTKTASQYNSLNNGAFIGKGTLNNVLNDRFANLTLSKLTQAQYNALSTKDANTMYIIVG